MADHFIKAEVFNFEPGCVGIYLDWESGRISARSVNSMEEAKAELRRLGVRVKPWTAEDIEDLEIGYKKLRRRENEKEIVPQRPTSRGRNRKSRPVSRAACLLTRGSENRSRRSCPEIVARNGSSASPHHFVKRRPDDLRRH